MTLKMLFSTKIRKRVIFPQYYQLTDNDKKNVTETLIPEHPYGDPEFQLVTRLKKIITCDQKKSGFKY